MKTLVLTVAPALPPRSGGDLRNAAHMRAAAALGPVLAVSLSGPCAEPGGQRVRCEALSGREEGACWTTPPGAAPGSADIRPEDCERMRALAAGFAPDIVIVEGIPLAALIAPATSSGAALILDMHNIESDLHAQIATSRTARWLRRWRAGRVADERRAMEEAERAAALAARMVWVCSPEDAARLARIAPGAAVATVPNSLPRPAHATPRRRVPDPRAPVLAFIGQLHYRPNVRAANTLARNVMPALARHCPGAVLHIAGRMPSRRVRRLHAPPRIVVTPDPDDVDAILAGADFAVIPLTEGGGTRIKALEAMAAGLVVIATPLAVEGLGLVDGRDAIIRGTPVEMAAEAARLARTPDAFLEIAAQGRETAIAAGDPARHAALVRGLLEAVP